MITSLRNEKKLKGLDIEKILKKQKLVFAIWNGSSKKTDPYPLFYLPLKKLFGKAILFDPRKIRHLEGSEKMNELFFSLIDKEKPNYVFTNVRRDEQTIETMEKIKEISPNTKIIAFSGDDDKDFEPLKRYQALFVDCTLVAQPNYLKNYYKDGVKNVFMQVGTNLDIHKPIKNVKKIYDVTFIGKPSKPRVEIVKLLIDNKISIKLFGSSWENYPEFKEFCFGPLKADEMIKLINQSKINLAFSKNKNGVPHFKGRVNMYAACKSFSLVDYFSGYLKFFKNNKEIVMFKDNQDLLEKIKYYLKHEKEREKIAENSYKRIIKEHDIFKEYKNLFTKMIEYPKIFSQKFPKIKGKIIILKKDDMKKSDTEIEELLNGFDYISFSDGDSLPLKYKNYLQAYSLEKTKKQISCCDYYVYDKILGNYLMTNIWRGFARLKREEFNQAISINQISVSKDYFIENLDKFKSFFEGEVINIIDEKNTCFISIPLVRIKKLNGIDSEIISSSFFHKSYAFNAYLLLKQKKIFNPILYRTIYLLLKNPALMNSLIKFLKNKKKWNQAISL